MKSGTGTVLRRPTLEWLAVTTLCIVLAVFAALEGWLWRIDQTIYDSFLSSFRRATSANVAIVAIDDASLAELGSWPWSRRVHAALLDRLHDAGARAVALDLILDTPSRDDPAADTVLAQSMRAFGRVALPLTQATTGVLLTGEILPLPEFVAAAAALGHGQVEFDPDGIARSVYLWEGFGSARHPQLALALLRIVDPEVAARYAQPGPGDDDDRLQWVRATWLRVPFAGPPGTYPYYSYAAVLRGEVPADALRDKVLLVGATASGMAEAVPTPMSGLSRPMPGVEVDANVYDALRRGDAVRPLSAGTSAGVAALAVLVAMLALFYGDPRTGLLVSVLAGLAALALAAVALQAGSMWFGPAPAVLGCMLAYPLWSWRRLEWAQRYLDAELAALEREGDALPSEVDRGAADRLERRIRIVRHVARQQRDVRRFIADTLEHLPIGVVVIDPGNRVVLHNERARHLLQAFRGEDLLAALRSLPWPVYLPMRDGLPDLAGFAGIRQFELPVGRRHLLLSVAELVAGTGSLSGRVIGLADVTVMHEAQRTREDTMHFLSHDLRAPLASILTLIDGYKGDPAAQAEQIPRIARYARSALDLADGLFRLVRAEGSDPKDFVELDLAGLVDSAADEVWPQAHARGIRVAVDTRAAETEEPIVRGDFSLLRRAVINLLTNAIKYGSPDSTVSAELAAEGADWVIRVRGQGAGIPPDALPRLFKRFSRIVEEGRDRPSGVGLGLLIVKTVAERHGGNVSVESTPGVGSMFEIRLPLRMRPDAPSRPD
ncbi:MAG TPA: CHASE2 and HATPase_c domain-containing protein [Rhodocyclaceae bacterium]|uniref:CHASE2 domain-containing protein n=1 Tax=Zoogloea sp. TaxID=49181 RepID=UPI002CDD1850|nr:CHASE2 domain-containing protein [Zoogloea sp.]HMV62471.1 CHASE2 and HATPase_c domain-containing protein [Rhodocyclaceae bacterium]HMY49484.1 CHASE2 and HATPase_c domain-containing protein [Rhodocyclaceae bacterium]HMZ75461.1 CHASE2 and HATPase_c domain-containing protein [Rhodocyclaceae bacterium]HNA67220.1 CHASE2 and HATPase_c domain-containing protein [Rhodocyclaceae bacterium]HNB64086.1 CHASE2 and HATPase_c domain-containing protein [Rhodocyclaceae bacterium]